MKTYILGDMLKKGSILMREQEAKQLREMGYDVYSAIEQKDINDKQNQTEESNNRLAERIFHKDTSAIRKSELIVAEVDNNNIGSCVEIGQIAEDNWWNDRVRYIVEHSESKEELLSALNYLIDVECPKKECYFHTTDIRHTDLKESGFRRSFSFNQYLIGACLSLNEKGIGTWEDIINELKKDKNSEIDFDTELFIALTKFRLKSYGGFEYTETQMQELVEVRNKCLKENSALLERFNHIEDLCSGLISVAIVLGVPIHPKNYNKIEENKELILSYIKVLYKAPRTIERILNGDIENAIIEVLKSVRNER